VRRLDALSVVALVANIVTRRNLTDVDFIRNPVSKNIFTVNHQAPISVVVLSPYPFEAPCNCVATSLAPETDAQTHLRMCCGDLGAGLGEDRGRVRTALAKYRDEVVNQAIDVIGEP
jgi:hypothetical protein